MHKAFYLSAIKVSSRHQSSKYLISINRFESYKYFESGIVGKVTSNYSGTIFHISGGVSNSPHTIEGPSNVTTDRPYNVFYPSSRAHSEAELLKLCKDQSLLKRERAVILYEPNFLGFRGPRKMTLLLPSRPALTAADKAPDISRDDLYESYTSRSIEQQQAVLVLKNKMPQWNEDTQSFVLNFHGRVSQASVKNFQIIHPRHDQEYIILQFGRVGTDTFTMDLQYPMDLLTAFGIALSSFDPKRLCE